MPFISQRAQLKLSSQDKQVLTRLSQSRTEPAAKVQRAQILLHYERGETISAIARALSTNRPKVERCVSKALELGVTQGLSDLPGRGRQTLIDSAARAWVVGLACQKPKELGYPQELWTTRLLAKHVRAHCSAAGHPSLAQLARGTVSKILSANRIQPHRGARPRSLRPPWRRCCRCTTPWSCGEPRGRPNW
jgi:hypothetical protein